jgi:hypothetical protein
VSPALSPYGDLAFDTRVGEYAKFIDSSLDRLEPNGNRGAPTAGGTGMGQLRITPEGMLSITEAYIRFANLAGDESLDPSLANDPFLGAEIRVDGLAMTGTLGSGLLFTGGDLTVTKDGHTLFAADVPRLIVEDDGLQPFGYNIWGELGDPVFDEAMRSRFLDSWLRFAERNLEFPMEFMATTAYPLKPEIRHGRLVDTMLVRHALTVSTPLSEPPSSVLALVALLGAALCMNGKQSLHQRCAEGAPVAPASRSRLPRAS